VLSDYGAYQEALHNPSNMDYPVASVDNLHIAADFGLQADQLPAMLFLRRMTDSVSDPPVAEDSLLEVR
jgi:hypothetical protein